MKIAKTLSIDSRHFDRSNSSDVVVSLLGADGKRVYVRCDFQAVDDGVYTTTNPREAGFFSMSDAIWVIQNIDQFRDKYGWEIGKLKEEPTYSFVKKNLNQTIVVLNDGETFSSAQGAFVLVISDDDAEALSEGHCKVSDIEPLLKIALNNLA